MRNVYLLFLLSLIHVQTVFCQVDTSQYIAENECYISGLASIEKAYSENRMDDAKRHLNIIKEWCSGGNDKILKSVENWRFKIDNHERNYEKITLFNGGIINCNIPEIHINWVDKDSIDFIDKLGLTKRIARSTILQIADNKGFVVYNAYKLDQAKKLFECKEKMKNLKQRFHNELLKEMEQMDYDNKINFSKYASMDSLSNLEMQANISERIDNLLEIVDVKFNIDASLKIHFDEKSKLINIKESFDESNIMTNYSFAKREAILPYLEENVFEVRNLKIDYSKAYFKVLDKYKNEFDAISCETDFEKDKYLRAKLEIVLTKNKERTLPSYYSINLNNNVTTKTERWKYHKSSLQTAGIENVPDSIVWKEFNDKLTYDVRGVYNVQMKKISSNSMSYDNVKVNKTHLKSVYRMSLGFLYLHYHNHVRLNEENITIDNHFSGFNIHIKRNAFGLFYGGIFSYKERSGTEEGINYVEKPKFNEYGGYLRLGGSSMLYLKMGYSSLKGELIEIKDGIETRKNIDESGFIVGFALAFPYVDLEGGYNSNLNNFFFGIGVNLYFNN